jgi:hypothetical protein
MANSEDQDVYNKAQPGFSPACPGDAQKFLRHYIKIIREYQGLPRLPDAPFIAMAVRRIECNRSPQTLCDSVAISRSWHPTNQRLGFLGNVPI